MTEDVNAGGASLELRGSVGGDLVARLSGGASGGFPTDAFPGVPALPSVPPGLTLAPGASVGGNLEYTLGSEIDVPSGVVAGEVIYEAPDASPGFGFQPRFRPGNVVRRYIALLIVGLALLILAPNFVGRASGQLGQRPWTGLGVGVLTLIGFPLVILLLIGIAILVAILLGLVTLGGLGAAVVVIGGAGAVSLAALFFLVLTYLTQVVVALTSGRWLLARLSPQPQEGSLVPLLLGLLLVVVLTAIPFLGLLATLVIVLFGLGALWFGWRGRSSAASAPA